MYKDQSAEFFSFSGDFLRSDDHTREVILPKNDQGISTDRYMTIPRVLVFITRDEDVLLIRGAPTKRIWANRYNGIGGHIERGEDPESAARRETLEETGLTVNKIYLCGTLIVDASEQVGVSIYIYRAEYTGGEILQSNEGHLEWVNIHQLSDLPMVEDLPILLDRVLRQRNGQPPFSARSFYDENEHLQVIFNDSDQ